MNVLKLLKKKKLLLLLFIVYKCNFVKIGTFIMSIKNNYLYTFLRFYGFSLKNI